MKRRRTSRIYSPNSATTSSSGSSSSSSPSHPSVLSEIVQETSTSLNTSHKKTTKKRRRTSPEITADSDILSSKIGGKDEKQKVGAAQERAWDLLSAKLEEQYDFEENNVENEDNQGTGNLNDEQDGSVERNWNKNEGFRLFSDSRPGVMDQTLEREKKNKVGKKRKKKLKSRQGGGEENSSSESSSSEDEDEKEEMERLKSVVVTF